MKLILFTTILVILVGMAATESPPETRTIDEEIMVANKQVPNIKGVDEGVIIEGDIVLPAADSGDREKRQAIHYLDRRWPNATVPYFIDPNYNYTAAEMESFQQALDDYERYTCVKLVNRTDESDYVKIVRETGCSSSVGMVGGEQTMNLATNCLNSKRVAIHEFLHALGIWHTQSRRDRDEHVEILWDNIRDEKDHNFNKHEEALLYNLTYDYESIMHYGKSAFVNYSLPSGSITIRTLNASYQDVIGNAKTFSIGDIHLLNEMYGCTAHCDDSIVCGEEQYKGPDCKCYCPSDDVTVPGVICAVQPTTTTTTAAPTTTTTMPQNTTSIEPTTTAPRFRPRPPSKYNATPCELSADFYGICQFNNQACPNGTYTDGMCRRPINKGQISFNGAEIHVSCCIHNQASGYPQRY